MPHIPVFMDRCLLLLLLQPIFYAKSKSRKTDKKKTPILASYNKRCGKVVHRQPETLHIITKQTLALLQVLWTPKSLNLNHLI